MFLMYFSVFMKRSRIKHIAVLLLLLMIVQLVFVGLGWGIHHHHNHQMTDGMHTPFEHTVQDMDQDHHDNQTDDSGHKHQNNCCRCACSSQPNAIHEWCEPEFGQEATSDIVIVYALYQFEWIPLIDHPPLA